MLRFVLYVSGRLALLGVVVFLALFVDHAAAQNTVSGRLISLPDNLAYAGLMAAAWLVCSIGMLLIDCMGRIVAGAADPYEDHPKMSPSVQPYSIDYGSLSSIRDSRRSAPTARA